MIFSFKFTRNSKTVQLYSFTVCVQIWANKRTNMTISELNIQRSELLLKFDELARLKKKLYSNIDVSLPMSEHEKSLNKELSLIGYKMNAINLEKRKLKLKMA